MKNVKKEVNFTKFRKQKSKERKDQKEKYNIRKIHLFFRERGKYNQINIKIKKI